MTTDTLIQDTPADQGAGAGDDKGTPPPAAAAASAPAKPIPDTSVQAPDKPLIGDGDAVDKTAQSPADFPDDWRQRLAKQLGTEFGGEEKILKQLERRGSVAEVLKWALNADKKIAKGEFKRPLPENPTDEELSTWRKENQVPEKAEEYSIDIGNGVVFGENDKPVIDDFLAHAHKANMPQPFVKEALAWYHQNQERQQIEQVEFDKTFKNEALQALKEEYGPELKANLNAISTIFANAPEGLYNSILTARTANGEKLGDHPDMIRWLTGLVREVNPMATVVPAGGSVQGFNDEVASLEKRMKDDYPGWMNDKQAQARLQELYGIQERMQQKRA